jgi:hypothetical protein
MTSQNQRLLAFRTEPQDLPDMGHIPQQITQKKNLRRPDAPLFHPMTGMISAKEIDMRPDPRLHDKNHQIRRVISQVLFNMPAEL